MGRKLIFRSRIKLRMMQLILIVMVCGFGFLTPVYAECGDPVPAGCELWAEQVGDDYKIWQRCNNGPVLASRTTSWVEFSPHCPKQWQQGFWPITYRYYWYMTTVDTYCDGTSEVSDSTCDFEYYAASFFNAYGSYTHTDTFGCRGGDILYCQYKIGCSGSSDPCCDKPDDPCCGNPFCLDPFGGSAGGPDPGPGQCQ